MNEEVLALRNTDGDFLKFHPRYPIFRTRHASLDHGTNKSPPDPETNAPRKFPFAQTLQATLEPLPVPLPPIHELSAATTAAESSRGTRTHAQS